MTTQPLLSIRGLHIAFGAQEVVSDFSLDINRGERVGLVGESGSGKSVSALATMGLLPRTGNRTAGTIQLQTARGGVYQLDNGQEKDWVKIRGHSIGMIFQEPMHSLNPVFRCGPQIAEAAALTDGVTLKEAKAITLKWMERVGLKDVHRIYQAFPHQLSGGQKQRIMIAMALCRNPELLIADEPTTALDLRIQRQIIDLLTNLSDELNLAVWFISHDLGIVRSFTDRVVVMRKGETLEKGSTSVVFGQPKHPYTKGLLACRPPMDKRLWRLPVISDFEEDTTPDVRIQSVPNVTKKDPLVQLVNASVIFGRRSSWFKRSPNQVIAMHGINIDIPHGITTGLVGESGSGKTTMGRSIVGLQALHSGYMSWNGKRITPHTYTDQRFRQKIQMIFQDPYASLNPRQTIGQAITEVLAIYFPEWSRHQRMARAVSLLEQVGLQADHQSRLPHQFSGGQRQRICIARALASEPELIVCDECVSALDVSVQAQVLNLLKQIQEELNLTYLFISHDMSVIRFMADQLAVMQNGEIKEKGKADDLLDNPQHPYTLSLLDAVI